MTILGDLSVSLSLWVDGDRLYSQRTPTHFFSWLQLHWDVRIFCVTLCFKSQLLFLKRLRIQIKHTYSMNWSTEAVFCNKHCFIILWKFVFHLLRGLQDSLFWVSYTYATEGRILLTRHSCWHCFLHCVINIRVKMKYDMLRTSSCIRKTHFRKLSFILNVPVAWNYGNRSAKVIVGYLTGIEQRMLPKRHLVVIRKLFVQNMTTNMTFFSESYPWLSTFLQSLRYVKKSIVVFVDWRNEAVKIQINFEVQQKKWLGYRR
jgi:hypothetical protein